jgi:hypothetical protein
LLALFQVAAQKRVVGMIKSNLRDPMITGDPAGDEKA